MTAFRSVAVAIATSVIAVPASGQSPSDGDWPIVSKDYANTRFSELAEITAANVATLKVVWNDPTPQPSSQGVACCDVVNRGAAYADGTVFFNTLGAHRRCCQRP